MKLPIYILFILGFAACAPAKPDANTVESADSVQTSAPEAEAMDTLPLIPQEAVQREFAKSLNAHSYHSLIKSEFAFNDWLTEVKDRDSIQAINSHIDSLMYIAHAKRDTIVNSDDKWHLKSLVMKGWYEQGLDRTNVNKCFVATSNKYRLRGEDLIQIFKKTEGWIALVPNENELIMMYGFWYPNGNQTSWEYFHYYHFQKTN